MAIVPALFRGLSNIFRSLFLLLRRNANLLIANAIVFAACLGALGCASNYRVLRTALDDESDARDLLGRTLTDGNSAEVDPGPIDLFKLKKGQGWIVKAGQTHDEKRAEQSVKTKVNLEVQSKCGAAVSVSTKDSSASSVTTTAYVEATDGTWIPLKGAKSCCAPGAPSACGSSVITRVYLVQAELTVTNNGSGELSAQCKEVLEGLDVSASTATSSSSSMVRQGWALVSVEPLSELCKVLR